MNYLKAKKRIEKLNRRIGQYHRRFYVIWNPEKLEAAENERRELKMRLPQLKREHEERAAFWQEFWQ